MELNGIASVWFKDENSVSPKGALDFHNSYASSNSCIQFKLHFQGVDLVNYS